MAVLKNDILSAAVYNTLPNVRNVSDVPEVKLADIADLRNLLPKHNLSDKVRIKLVHINFRLKEGEVFVARDIEAPKHGSINTMHSRLASQHQSPSKREAACDCGSIDEYRDYKHDSNNNT